MGGRGIIHSLVCVLSLFILTLLLMACGGGGGDGGGSGAPSTPSITYTGIPTQTAVTAENAKLLATGAYQGATFGPAITISGAVVNETKELPYVIHLSDALTKVLDSVTAETQLGTVLAGAKVTKSGTEQGPYGGSASYTITEDEYTGEFTGSITYSNFSMNPGVTVSGSVPFYGNMDVNTEAFVFFRMTYSAVTITMPGISITIQGEGILDHSVASVEALTILSAYCKDNNSGKVYWLRGYAIVTRHYDDYYTFYMQGTYYHPDYGYVIMKPDSNTLFRVNVGDKFPSQGIMEITGKTGVGGSNTNAKLTVLSPASYQVEADTSGDGSYDWNSGTINW